jgi:hypothetical protein
MSIREEKLTQGGTKVADLRVAALSYTVGADHIYVTLVDQEGRTQIFRLLKCEVAFPLIDKLVESLSGSYPSRGTKAVFERFSCDWGKNLLPPLSELRDFDILVIIPHHLLYGLPFHAISANGQFLGLSHGITYCSSVALFRQCIGNNSAREHDLSRWTYTTDSNAPREAPRKPKKCLGLGIDILGDHVALYRELAEHFSGFFESWSIAGVMPRFELKQPSYDAMCLVCHGYYDPMDPNNCGLLLDKPTGTGVERPIVLGQGAANFRDLPFRHLPPEIQPKGGSSTPEFMTINELKVDANCRAELVALFGCWTGAGSPASVEDPGSLAEQWLRIGAASVLANLWGAYFPVLKRWVEFFLLNWLTRRQPKAIAWREATRAMLSERSDLPLSQWANIVLMGDWL